MSLKRNALKTIILGLFQENDKISLKTIAEKAGISFELSANRRAIQRVLAVLRKQGIVQAEGKARAQVYSLIGDINKNDSTVSFVHHARRDLFNDIPLSAESSNLLDYLSKPIQARDPVGYSQEFLRAYEPNQSYYLGEMLRSELAIIGKAEPIARPAGTYARHILNRLLIDLSWNSSRLEGNTYSLLETKRLIEFGENAEGKGATEAQMILNHKEAIEYIMESVDEKHISSHEVFSIHALLSENLLGDPSASGRLRNIAVDISGTTYLPIDNPHVLKECFELFIHKLNLIADPFEQSFFAMVHLPYLQAFEDVNKRTSRLVANIPLIKQNIKPFSFMDMKQEDYVTCLLGVYEKNDISLLRDLYVWAYKRSAQRYSALQQAMGEPNLFKLKYRADIQKIIQALIVSKIPGSQVVSTIKDMVKALGLNEQEANQLFSVIETELINLHDGNIARFKVKPSEFRAWKSVQ